MTTLCIYHNDTDGRASAAIVRRALGQDILLYEMKYGDSLPLEELLVADHIIIVDFSLEPEDMKRLATYHQVTWIDHHKTAIAELGELGDELPGIRDVNEAACVLTWKYFYPEERVPFSIRLIGDRDIWRWELSETGPFNEGLYQKNTNPKNDKLWEPLFQDERNLINQLIDRGKTLREARLRGIQSSTARFGFAVIFEGHRTLAVNLRGSGDLGEHIRNHGYEIAYCYVDCPSDGEIYTFVSLYSKEIDVSKIAHRFGGGGHAGAAGFHFKRSDSPFPPGANITYTPKE